MDKDFEKISTELSTQGYKLKSCEFDITLLFLSSLLVAPLANAAFIGYLIQEKTHPEIDTQLVWWEWPLLTIVLVFIHELIHGASFAAFSKNGFKSLKFGLSKQSFYCPFCHCKTTLSKTGYFISVIMPFIILGIIPSIVSIVLVNGHINSFAIMGIISGAVDILCCCELLKQKKNLPHKGKILVYDYVDKMGFAVFYKEKDVND